MNLLSDVKKIEKNVAIFEIVSIAIIITLLSLAEVTFTKLGSSFGDNIFYTYLLNFIFTVLCLLIFLGWVLSIRFYAKEAKNYSPLLRYALLAFCIFNPFFSLFWVLGMRHWGRNPK